MRSRDRQRVEQATLIEREDQGLFARIYLDVDRLEVEIQATAQRVIPREGRRAAPPGAAEDQASLAVGGAAQHMQFVHPPIAVVAQRGHNAGGRLLVWGVGVCVRGPRIGGKGQANVA